MALVIALLIAMGPMCRRLGGAIFNPANSAFLYALGKGGAREHLVRSVRALGCCRSAAPLVQASPTVLEQLLCTLATIHRHLSSDRRWRRRSAAWREGGSRWSCFRRCGPSELLVLSGWLLCDCLPAVPCEAERGPVRAACLPEPSHTSTRCLHNGAGTSLAWQLGCAQGRGCWTARRQSLC